MLPIKEADWKTLRQLHPVALDRYCQRILEEIARLGNSAGKSAHQRYIDVYRLVESRDKELERVFSGYSRSRALHEILALREHGLLTEQEYWRFSEETRGLVDTLGSGHGWKFF